MSQIIESLGSAILNNTAHAADIIDGAIQVGQMAYDAANFVVEVGAGAIITDMGILIANAMLPQAQRQDNNTPVVQLEHNEDDDMLALEDDIVEQNQDQQQPGLAQPQDRVVVVAENNNQNNNNVIDVDSTKVRATAIPEVKIPDTSSDDEDAPIKAKKIAKDKQLAKKQVTNTTKVTPNYDENDFAEFMASFTALTTDVIVAPVQYVNEPIEEEKKVESKEPSKQKEKGENLLQEALKDLGKAQATTKAVVTKTTTQPVYYTPVQQQVIFSKTPLVYTQVPVGYMLQPMQTNIGMVYVYRPVMSKPFLVAGQPVITGIATRTVYVPVAQPVVISQTFAPITVR